MLTLMKRSLLVLALASSSLTHLTDRGRRKAMDTEFSPRCCNEQPSSFFLSYTRIATNTEITSGFIVWATQRPRKPR
jgi:hypothetical protein